MNFKLLTIPNILVIAAVALAVNFLATPLFNMLDNNTASAPDDA